MNCATGARLTLLTAAVGASSCIAADPKLEERNAMNDAPTASRPRPPRVLPIEHAGVRYMQDMQARRFGGEQSGGYLVAVDPTSGERLWMLKVYRVADHSGAGVDDIGVHFRSMKLLAGEDTIEVENEVGGVFRVDLRSRNSRHVSGPESRR